VSDTQQLPDPGGPGLPEPARVVSPEGTGSVLLAAAARALRGADCADLGRRPAAARVARMPRRVRRRVAARVAGGTALAPERVGEVDADRVADWVVDHYPARSYPAVVLGSPHGAAVHLAAALGAPWLPTGFDLEVGWPWGGADDPVGALAHGTRLAAPLLAGNPEVRLRQVHDPLTRGALCGASVAFAVRWCRLPGAYRRFLDACLRPGAVVLLLRDARTWPVLDTGAGHSFQVGGPAGGLDPADYRPGGQVLARLLYEAGGDADGWRSPGEAGYADAEHGVEAGFEASLRRWTAHRGVPLHHVLFSRPEALSAATADVYRGWLRAAGKSGDRCVVSGGRLLDPWQVLRAGLVPYWCEGAGRRVVSGAEWWLAGSEPFTSVDVLPGGAGCACPELAGLSQWSAVASFGRRRGVVDRVTARGYPVTAVATCHATSVLRGHGCDLPPPPALPVSDALAGLRHSGTVQGLLVC
jgi:hypothetical protein